MSMRNGMDEPVGSFAPSGTRGLGAHFAHLAERYGERTAVVFNDRRISFGDLDQSANRLARSLQTRRVAAGSRMVILLPNSPQVYELALAAWKIGAVPVPLNVNSPQHELQELVELAEPAIIVCESDNYTDDRLVGVGDIYLQSEAETGDPHPDVESRPYKISGTGGSTGRPKLVISHDRGPVNPRVASTWGMRPFGTAAVVGPLYHSGPFNTGLMQLSIAGTIVLLTRFDAGEYLDLIERERVTWSFLVPTMLHRVLRLPQGRLRAADLSSIEVLLLTGAPTTVQLKLEAIELLGASRVWEAYGATEVLCSMIRGDEWLLKKGSVGRPLEGVTVQVVDESGRELPPGSIGEIFVRPPLGPRYSYQGGHERIIDGSVSVGDLGYVDEDGYLFIVDRRTDMIVSGGANVYCAEVEESHSRPSECLGRSCPRATRQ